MSSETVNVPPTEVLDVLGPPDLDSLDEARGAGRVCIWGGESLTIETAVGLCETEATAANCSVGRSLHRLVGARSPHASPPLSHMTMRVYQVDRYGTVTRDSGRVIVPPPQELTPTTDRYPPCQCPRHRVGQGKPR
ncbi:hypothetical protein ACIQGO_01650 [Streptomyces shenzhenensis]|uniref:hypothetical protein n=1 Tax=Streptomyces shenzhenensis TaxID=943815 RepID=UPI0038147DC7